jgi:hypothetical protein
VYIDAWRDTWYLEFEENLKDVVHGQHFAVIPKGHIPVQRQLSCHVFAQERGGKRERGRKKESGRERGGGRERGREGERQREKKNVGVRTTRAELMTHT